ncbi:MAG TPA: enoyl-CoA hydratase-related protein [Acidimicrobiales bacterium]|nr:enoyl-CoA hydratase-related protein [Acidimicrobiales bacterium]
MAEEVLYTAGDGVATITLNRPDKYNAATFDMADEFRAALARAAEDDAVRCVVLTGAGKAFCSGDDVEAAWGDPRMADTMAELAGPNPPLTPEIAAMLDLSKPTIAAVNGVALGIGMDFAIACDIRYASEKARFGQLFVKMGLMADVSGYWRLPQLVGPSAAAEMLFTGDMFDAAEALRLGLVSRVLPPDELLPAAHDLAARIAANPPLALQRIKEGLRRAAGMGRSDLDDLARFVGHGLSELFASDDHKAAVAKFMQR